MIDYALWEVIKNGTTLPKTPVVKGVTTVMPITSVEDKAQRRLEVKEMCTLIMGIPNEHQLKFNSIKDVKQLLEAIEKRFGGNAATKKTQRNLLKQQYENFTASNSEMLDQTFDRLQKLMSQLELLSEKLSQEDVNQKGERDVKLKFKHTKHAFVSSSNNSFTNGVVNTAQAVNTANENKSILMTWKNRFEMANGCVDLEGQKILKKTGRKLTINENKTIGLDKSNVEYYNCHKRRHFARECRASRNQDTNYKESTRRNVHVETPASTALVSCYCLGGYDWSDQAKEGPNYELMAFTSSSLNTHTNITNTKEVILQEEQQDLLADGLEDLDSDSPTSSVIFMARLSLEGSVNGDYVNLTYHSDILYEVPHYDTYHETDMINPVVQ
nr:ribonuclease H-like domain-containing protein [Tanacetum cinerariifolium]